MPPARRLSTVSTRRSTASRRPPVVVYHQAAARAAKRRLTAAPVAGLDLAARLRVVHRSLRGHVERRDALLDMMRAVNTTLEPTKIAELVIDRASSWMPAPCWGLVSSDQSGELSLLAERGLEPD